MSDNSWRYSAISVTKYDPAFRDKNGIFTKNEWLGFSDVGKKIGDDILTFEVYLEVEKKYIAAARYFFDFHKCTKILLKNVERIGNENYGFSDKEILCKQYENIFEEMVITISDLDKIIKLILRDFLWAELLCVEDNSVAVRFGYDYYMYFNSTRSLTDLHPKISKMGLYID